MQITTARDLQNHFKAELQITGEDKEGNLEWMGEKINWYRLSLLEGFGEPDYTRDATDYL